MSLIKVSIYTTSTGKEPYSEWEDDLDTRTRAIVKSRLERVRLGNFGQAKQLKGGDGIWELVLDVGPGYRIYFGKKGTAIVVLLVGGEKRSQSRDIAKAKRYWNDCKEHL